MTPATPHQKAVAPDRRIHWQRRCHLTEQMAANAVEHSRRPNACREFGERGGEPFARHDGMFNACGVQRVARLWFMLPGGACRCASRLLMDCLQEAFVSQASAGS
jgi:hypothetical protein